MSTEHITTREYQHQLVHLMELCMVVSKDLELLHNLIEMTPDGDCYKRFLEHSTHTLELSHGAVFDHVIGFLKATGVLNLSTSESWGPANEDIGSGTH